MTRQKNHAGMTVPQYDHEYEGPNCTMAYLRPVILEMVGQLQRGTRVLDVGCGRGEWIREFLKLGCECVGIDPSEQGIHMARKACPGARFEILTIDDSVIEQLDEEPFDLVISTEVVEHVFLPRIWAKGCLTALKPGGRFVCSTPYHGYVKNLALSLLNKWDQHHTPLWDGGHIKFWSRRTLAMLLNEAGFVDQQFRGAGRLPHLWMSMVISARRPGP
jgi:2-polyprenyl-3-methyl-5-hydroxy-6-metoxy-1,4-benzoquinol methylase